MRSVVELPPEPHGEGRPDPGYRLEVRDCLRCGRDLHLYVPLGQALGLVVTSVPCPHCHGWEAETLVPEISKPIFVRACERTWLAWLLRSVVRVLRTAAA